MIHLPIQRLIDATALLAHEKEADRMGAMLVVGKGHILSAPTIDPERYARWIPNSPFTGNCSGCGADGNLKQRYCGDCGSRMNAPDADESLRRK